MGQRRRTSGARANIGEERRHDQERSGLRRCHHDREQAHRDSRQAETDHPLDETGEQERRRDHGENGKSHTRL
jgi:hypothetical protein